MHPFYDFLSLWAAGRLISMGQNPYEYDQLINILSTYGYNHQVGAFYYPPNAFWIFSILGSLPLELATALWMGLIIFSIQQTLSYVLKLLSQNYSNNNEYIYYYTCFFPPLILILYLGQSTFICLLALIAFYRLITVSGFLAGVCLSLSAIKPHLFIPLYSYTVFKSANKKGYTLILGFIFALLSQYFIATKLSPIAINQYFLDLYSFHSYHLEVPHPTIGHVLNQIFNFSSFPTFLLLIGIFLSLWLAIKKKNSLVSGFKIILPISLLTAPFIWGHDLVLLLPQYLFYNLLTDKIYGQKYRIIIALVIYITWLLSIGQLSYYIFLWLPIYILVFELYLSSRLSRISDK